MPLFYTPGRYLGRCDEVAFRRTSKGAPMAVVVFTIVGRKERDESGEEQTRELEQQWPRTIYLPFSPAAKEYSLDKLEACGWVGDDLTSLRHELPGSFVPLYCKEGRHRDTGEPTEDWDVETKRRGSTLEHDEGVEKAAQALLGTMLRGRASARRAQQGTRPSPPPAPPQGAPPAGPPMPPVHAYEGQAGGDDDDIPF